VRKYYVIEIYSVEFFDVDFVSLPLKTKGSGFPEPLMNGGGENRTLVLSKLKLLVTTCLLPYFKVAKNVGYGH
jgi:hypothetical protein